MKKDFLTLFITALMLVTAGISVAQTQMEDVVYLKNGSIIRGTIIETVPEQSIKIRTRDGNVLAYMMTEIEKITKETAGPPLITHKNVSTPFLADPVESWYLYFAIGYGKAYYPTQLQQSLDGLGSSVSHVSISLDIPGVYWSLSNRKTIIGGVINGVADRYEDSGNSLQFNHYTFAFSTMHFLTGEIGDGVFLRGDIGIAAISAETSQGISVSSDAGFGVLIGGGYSIPVSSETRIVINMNYGTRKVESENYGALSINVGVLL